MKNIQSDDFKVGDLVIFGSMGRNTLGIIIHITHEASGKYKNMYYVYNSENPRSMRPLPEIYLLTVDNE